MVDSLEVPCFRYFGKDLTARLVVEHGTGSDLLVRCPVRKGLYFLTPEERVRQALVWFLLKGANGAPAWRKQLRFEVEQKISTWRPSWLERIVTSISLPMSRFLLSRPSDKSENRWMIRK